MRLLVRLNSAPRDDAADGGVGAYAIANPQPPNILNLHIAFQ